MSGVGNSRAKRMENYLAKIGEKLGLTECGRKWLIMALDPFNDNLDNHEGFPDGTGSVNIVEQIKETATITNQNLSNLTVNWDCLVLDLPWIQPVKLNYDALYESGSGTNPNAPVNLINVINCGTHSTGAFFGGVTVLTALSSQNNWAFGGSTAYSGLVVAPAATVFQGPYRVTNKGFEIANTTAPLYKQGSVQIFRIPTPTMDAKNTCMIYGGAGLIGAADVLNVDSWPINSGQAFTAVDTIQHNAELGVYVPSVFNTLNLVDECKVNMTQPFLVNTLNGGESANTNFFTPPVSANSGGSTNGYTGVEWAPFHLSGCLFTGLSPQTSLQLNAKWGIEIFPTVAQANLVALARRTPPRDPIAIELYSHIIQSMPVGCRFDDNGFGDWISGALQSASDFIAPVLSAIPHPIAQGASKAIQLTNAIAHGGGGSAGSGAAAASIMKQAENSMRANRNAQIRAKNEEIRARKALKGLKGGDRMTSK